MTTFPEAEPVEATTSALSRRALLGALASGAMTAPLVSQAASTPTRRVASTGRARSRSILIRNGTVLSLDRAVGDFERADVLVEGGKISAVRPGITAPSAEVIDASNAIVMPGFIDTHRHMWLGYLRNILPDGSFDDYKGLVQRKLGVAMTPEDVYAANLLSAVGAIDSGVTTVLDWSQISNTPEHSDAAIHALADSGIRAVYAYGNPQAASGKFWDAPAAKFPGDIARLRNQYFSSSDQLLTLFMAAPTGAPEVALAAFKAGRDVGAPISIHVGMGEAGRGGLLQQLATANALGPDITYVHCATLNDREWDIIKETGGTLSLSSYTEMLMGHGNPPIQKALDLDLRPSLSLDVETTAPNDFFNQMRSILSLQKNQIWARQFAGEKNLPQFLTTRQVLEFATVEGARANALERVTGTLTPGKAADIIMLRTDRSNVAPMNNAVGAVVTSMGPQNVDTVLINGKVVKRNGELVGIDWKGISRLGAEAQERNYRNAGIPMQIL